ncbi:hypothetical protein Tcan_00209 [Toxocara canis]|uniref:Uncharacterized protein n=1 Tax=Toxocara canis TaxID=6265 RepID=A0A0B2W3K2_TOXCA|nr:hypothetical protein Tcan_00209 [Toxocara canis]
MPSIPGGKRHSRLHIYCLCSFSAMNKMAPNSISALQRTFSFWHMPQSRAGLALNSVKLLHAPLPTVSKKWCGTTQHTAKKTKTSRIMLLSEVPGEKYTETPLSPHSARTPLYRISPSNFRHLLRAVGTAKVFTETKA